MDSCHFDTSDHKKTKKAQLVEHMRTVSDIDTKRAQYDSSNVMKRKYDLMQFEKRFNQWVQTVVFGFKEGDTITLRRCVVLCSDRDYVVERREGNTCALKDVVNHSLTQIKYHKSLYFWTKTDSPFSVSVIWEGYERFKQTLVGCSTLYVVCESGPNIGKKYEVTSSGGIQSTFPSGFMLECTVENEHVKFYVPDKLHSCRFTSDCRQYTIDMPRHWRYNQDAVECLQLWLNRNNRLGSFSTPFLKLVKEFL